MQSHAPQVQMFEATQLRAENPCFSLILSHQEIMKKHFNEIKFIVISTTLFAHAAMMAVQ